MRKIVLLLSLLLAGCANQDFPFCCDQTGDKNVPYVTTYDMSVNTGFINIGGDSSFLRIISQGDIANLFNAANVSKVPGTGVIGGGFVTPSGTPASGIILAVTDANGNNIGDLFYNSLGGIPDFSTSSAGSGSSGSFTLLNAPPGEVYFKAVQGGRGNGQAFSYADSAFLAKFTVIPVIPPFIGVTGGVLDYGAETKVNSSSVAPIGLKGLSVSAPSGSYRFPRLGSDSSFLIQATASGYLPTSMPLRTDLSSRPEGAIDVTQNLYLFSQALLTQDLNQTRYLSQDFAKGILAGSTRDQDDSARVNPHILLTDDQGSNLNFNGSKPRLFYHGTYVDQATGTNIPAYFYFNPGGTPVTYIDSSGILHNDFCLDKTLTCPPPAFGGLDGKFIAFDLPPGTVHLSATALDRTDAGFDLFTGEESADIFPGSVSIKNISMNKMDLGVSDYYLGFTGKVTRSDGVTPVGFATIFAIGNASSLTTVDSMGNFSIPSSQKIFLNQTTYTFRVSNPPSFVDTYQDLKIDLRLKNLMLYPMTVLNLYLSAAGLSASLDSTRGVLTGRIMDNLSGRGTDGVSLEATDISGNIVGDIRYFDSSGLPTGTSSSSKNGGYIIFNLPPGLVQIRVVSQDDSGNILAHIYPNGIVIADLQANNSPPPAVQVSGSTKDLDGTPMGQVNLSVMGDAVKFLSDGSGHFSSPFSPYSQFTLKAKSPQSGGVDTYNLFQTDIGDINPLNLYSLTAGKLQTGAGAAGLAADLTQGFIGGKVTTSGFSSSLPMTGFASSPMAPTDIAPHKIVTGLLDEDREADLAVVNSSDNTLTVLLGGGDGTFRMASGSPLCMPGGAILLPGQSCPGLAQPVAVRIRDLNGDGIADLIVANKGGDSITILLGTRQGNFVPAPGSPIALPAGSRPIDISVGDFNNDSFVDLVVLNSGNNSFSVLLGNGNGTFSSQIYSFYSGGSSPSAILNRDFNGDGNLDLAVVNRGSNSVSVFFGYGTGNFSPAPNSPLVVGLSPIGIAADDLNGDGVFDLVVANFGSSSVSVLLGKGGGLFSLDLCQAASPPPFCALNGAPESITLQDLNFDGRLDLVTSSNSGDVSVLTGLGNGTFAPEVRYPVGGNPSNLAFSNFNDDGFMDIVALQASMGTLALLPGVEAAVPNVSLQASDLDGNSVGQVRYYLNGNLVPPATSARTDSSGRFLIFNLPSGLKNIQVTQGASGNRFMTSYPGSATFGNIPVIPPDFRLINFSGKTIDPVGDQIARNVEGVNISVLGTGSVTGSDRVKATFNLNPNANSFLFFKLQK